MTGLWASCYCLPQLRSVSSINFQPEFGDVVEKPGDEPEVEAATATELLHTTKMFQGWRCSYRSDQPEHITPARISLRLKNKFDRMAEVSTHLTSGRRHLGGKLTLAARTAAAAKRRRGSDARWRAAVCTRPSKKPAAAGVPDPDALSLFNEDE
jgi:hypothetical protein